MSLIKKLAGETAVYGLSSIVGRLLNFLLTPLYTRALVDTGDYGVVIELYAYTGFMMVLFSYRMESAFFRFGTSAEDRETAFGTSSRSVMLSTLLFLGAILLFAQPIANWLQYGTHPEYIRYFGLILAFDCLSEIPFARLRLEQRPLRFVAAKLVGIGLNVSLNLFWLVACPWLNSRGHTWVTQVWDPSFKVGYIFLSNVIASGATLLVLSPYLLHGLRDLFDKILWGKMMRYALPLVLVGFAGIANEMLDRAILTRILPGTIAENRAQLGIYGANYKLAMLITLFTQAYRYAAEPFFFRHATAANALDIQARATKWFTIAAAWGMLGILLFLDIVKYFLGVHYHSGLHVVPVLLMANLLLGIYYNFSVWYRLKDRTMTGAWIALGGAGITLVLNLWWDPIFGYTGAAWATLACYFFMSAATWYAGRKIYPAPYQLGRMALYCVAVLVLYAAAELSSNVITSGVILWPLRIVLFAAFGGLVYILEGKELKRLL